MNISPVKKMLVTEKASILSAAGKYVFLVEPSATKTDIKKAMKELYKVDVINVRTLRQQPMRRRYRGKLVLKQAPKKAIVTVKAGQKIDIN
jgi:large subunit ribosomal protein L23